MISDPINSVNSTRGSRFEVQEWRILDAIHNALLHVQNLQLKMVLPRDLKLSIYIDLKLEIHMAFPISLINVFMD